MAADTEERCINEGGKTPCRGPVEWRTTPDRTDGKNFLRCEGHWEERMESVSRTLELTSPATAIAEIAKAATAAIAATR